MRYLAPICWALLAVIVIVVFTTQFPLYTRLENVAKYDVENAVEPMANNAVEPMEEDVFDSGIEKNIFILWLQGWDSAGWLNKQVAESWEVNNPGWRVHYIDAVNLKQYVQGIDYIYDANKDISPAAKSDIIRLALLNKHGGVWADATLLCMQPLDKWVDRAVDPAGLWMYHGTGGGMSVDEGPASWFIVSKKGSYMISKWKAACDDFWNSHGSTDNYFWMDALFKNLYETDSRFRNDWSKTPYLNCEEDGMSHTLATHGMEKDTPHIKKLFKEQPPYALKLWSRWHSMFPDPESEDCKKSNGYYAIQMSKRA